MRFSYPILEFHVLITALLAGLLTGVVQASFFEWTFHRYWLHRPWLPKDVFTAHTLIHHQLCKHDDTFEVHDEEQHEALHFQWWGGPLLVLINLVPWSIAAVILWLTHVEVPSIAFIAAMGFTILVYYAGYEGFHYLMHKPSNGWIERSGYFQFIKRHHRIHHNQMDRNLNVLFPLADLCMGTMVRTAPMAAQTPDSARKLARRFSRFGRRLRGEER